MSAPTGSPPVPPHISPGPKSSRLRKACTTLLEHVKKHAGVGIVCAVAYFDPGNWGVDLQAGSLYGYRLLFVVLLAGLFAVFLQVLGSRLGCVTGLDLASHTRLLLYNRPRHTRLFRWLALYPLYVLSEVAIMATDLAELLGSAIALCLLFPKLQLWQGVLLTATDVILILAMGDPLRGRPVRMFELLIAAMVLAVFICMAIIISKIDIDAGNVFQGFLPSKYVFASGGLYTSIGIIGATVMPHSLFIGSALATQDRIDCRPIKSDDDLPLSLTSTTNSEVRILVSPSRFCLFRRRLKTSLINVFRAPPKSLYATRATRHNEHENNPLSFVRAHIYHGIVDVVICLLGFAVLINSLILILASAVFYYGNNDLGDRNPASLFDAYELIKNIVGKPAATLFAVALLASGQSSSFIATVAGQAVSEGFIQWRTSPVIRRLATRLLAIVPSVVVAIAVGKQGINSLLIISQVILSLVLPFITLPLLYCTSSKMIMRVRKCNEGEETVREGGDVENADQWVDYSNGKVTIFIGILIWLIVVGANGYVLISLMLGNGA
ncbi:natural resistance-associated macrophage protein [Macrolepiota fuliginosa MF-IS2]|uniref:Natural resistance-associated macrophage protein n=1 Tax=Macrolepiota fuliginosa MF-IS2 TaxID=1400762 RepID=A0A9P5XEK3_9AGAR|nr:natural resistance-associated macrophage protein [Macrolepiota fuliginosa MF-IS2]